MQRNQDVRRRQRRREAGIDKNAERRGAAFCITCHNAQGSEWRNVLILDDGFALKGKHYNPSLRRRWFYTAVTRASETLTMIKQQ